MIRTCKVCGAVYKTCYSCEKERSWRMHTDTNEHYYLWSVLMEYAVSGDAKQAYSALRKRGIDLRNTEGFIPSVQATLTEINTLVHEKSRAREVAAEVEAPQIEIVQAVEPEIGIAQIEEYEVVEQSEIEAAEQQE